MCPENVLDARYQEVKSLKPELVPVECCWLGRRSGIVAHLYPPSAAHKSWVIDSRDGSLVLGDPQPCEWLLQCLSNHSIGLEEEVTGRPCPSQSNPDTDRRRLGQGPDYGVGWSLFTSQPRSSPQWVRIPLEPPTWRGFQQIGSKPSSVKSIGETWRLELTSRAGDDMHTQP
jgi:hypothetical protein